MNLAAHDAKDYHWIKSQVRPRYDPADSHARSVAAKRSVNTMTKEKHGIAMRHQKRMAGLLGGKMIPGNRAFDIMLDEKNVIEVKTVIDASNDKITVHPWSLRRKNAMGAGKKRWTVVVDVRGGRPVYYLFNSLGSFRLGKKHKPISLAQIRHAIAGGK